MRGRGALLVISACAVALALGGCDAVAGGTGDPGAGTTASASATGSSDAAEPVGDVCALLPEAELRAAVGADPGEGVAAKGRIDGGQCTWKVSDTHTAVVQVTRQPDVFLPDSAWKRPESAADVEGVDRGWAAAETHTILLVKDGRGCSSPTSGSAERTRPRTTRWRRRSPRGSDEGPGGGS